MNAELQEQLAKEFTFMKRKPLKDPKRIDDLYGAFGIETGNGWYAILHNLCSNISQELNAAGIDNQSIVIDQIKEKYGTLRFYYHFEGDDIGIHAFDCITPSGIESLRIKSKGECYKDRIAELVSECEDLSGKTCEMCGSDAVLRTDLGWIRTLCNTCYQGVITRMKKE